MGWLLLLPLALSFWLAIIIANACVKRGWRFLGILASLIIGGINILVGYWFGIEGFIETQGLESYIVTYPVLGWILMIGGGLIAALGTWTALAATKEEIEVREEMEKLDKKRTEEERKLAKELARNILEQGNIDDYESFNWAYNTLDKIGFDTEAISLLENLKKLAKKQEKELKNKG